uniref:EF-hand domain-containing protein n=2 Tax=Bursaphelenchus xylophilus TaxID=6326 RepID=A0A1I7RWC6_BURXY
MDTAVRNEVASKEVRRSFFEDLRRKMFQWPIREAQCEYTSLQNIPRANFDKLKEVFHAYASVEKNGKKHMTDTDFIRRYLGLYTEDNYNKETVRLLASAADTSKDGLISFEEFCAFEATLCA